MVLKNRIKSKSISRIENANLIEPEYMSKHKHVSPSVNRKAQDILGLLDNPKYIRNHNGVLYSVKGQHKYRYNSSDKTSAHIKNGYRRSVNQSQKELEKNQKILSLGIVGEQLSSNSSRRNLYNNPSARKMSKNNSVDMKLPRISDSNISTKDDVKSNNGSISNVKLPNLNKYNHGKYFMKNPKLIYGKKQPNIGGPNQRYKYVKASVKDVYNDYLGKADLKSQK